MSYFLDLELQATVSHHVGVGNWTRVLCKSRSAFNHWAIPSLQPPKLLLYEESKEEKCWIILYYTIKNWEENVNVYSVPSASVCFHYQISKNRKDFIYSFNTLSSCEAIPTGALLGPSFPRAAFPCGLYNYL
jgi:hypothetical protein